MVWSVQASDGSDGHVLTAGDFSNLCASGEIISRHGIYGPKVIRLPDGNYLKVFNPKPGFTKRHFFPKYKSFIHNAEKLNALGIPCVQIKDVYFLSEHQSYAVLYSPLHGTDLRTLAHQHAHQTLENLIPFVVRLHEKGVYFRGIHLGNVLQLEDGRHGLIDVADASFSCGALNIFKRARNLRHMLKNKEDKQFYEQFGVQDFINLYVAQAHLSFIQKKLFSLYF